MEQKKEEKRELKVKLWVAIAFGLFAAIVIITTIACIIYENGQMGQF